MAISSCILSLTSSQVCTWFASRGVLIRASRASPLPPPPPPHPVNPDQTLCRGKGGGNPRLDWKCKTLLLNTNQKQTRHYYAISNQPTALLSINVTPVCTPPPPICSFAISSTSSQFREWQSIFFFSYPPHSLLVNDARERRKKGQSLNF